MNFTPDQLLVLLSANWPRAAHLVNWALSVLKIGEDGRAQRYRLLEAARILRPAESFVRRLLIILACRLLPEMTPPKAKATAQTAPPSPAPASGAAQTDAATFSPIEPISPFRTEPAPPRPVAWPSIWSPGQVRPENLDVTGPDPFEWIDAAAWLTRAKRLAAVIANPDPYANRVARWLQRASAIPKGAIGRRIPLRPFALMPGHASAALDRLTRSALHYSDAGAQAALRGAWNSS
ncbi:MAG: hypothetical protein ACK46Q_11780 [Hyphomonas sp.]